MKKALKVIALMLSLVFVLGAVVVPASAADEEEPVPEVSAIEKGFFDFTDVLVNGLVSGIASVTYKQNDVSYTRTLFASYPAQVIAMRLTSDKPGAISFTASYDRENDLTVSVSDNIMHVGSETEVGGHRFDGKIRFDI